MCVSHWTWGKVMCFCSNVLGMRGLDRQGSLWHAPEGATFHPLVGLWLWSRVTSGCKWWKGMKKVVTFWMLNIILNIYDLVASKIASGGDFTNNTTAAWHQPALVYPRSIMAQRGQQMFTHFILDSEPHRFMALNKTWNCHEFGANSIQNMPRQQDLQFQRVMLLAWHKAVLVMISVRNLIQCSERFRF